jgi:hypothetical protein
MQPEGLIADDEAVVGGLAVARGLHKRADSVYHILPAALTQGQRPAGVGGGGSGRWQGIRGRCAGVGGSITHITNTHVLYSALGMWGTAPVVKYWLYGS